MANWYDPWLTDLERRTMQISTSAITARRRKKATEDNARSISKAGVNGAPKADPQKNSRYIGVQRPQTTQETKEYLLEQGYGKKKKKTSSEAAASRNKIYKSISNAAAKRNTQERTK